MTNDRFYNPPPVGHFDKLMSIVQNSTTDTADGGTTGTPAVFTQLWCSIEPLTGLETWIDKTQQAKVSHLIRGMWQPGIKPQMKGIYAGRTFNFMSVVDTNERHIELRITADEVIEPAP